MTRYFFSERSQERFSQARNEAGCQDAVPVSLINGEQLAIFLAFNGLGVTRQTHAIFKLDEEKAESGNSGAFR